MRDYRYCPDNREPCFVSDMLDTDLDDCLSEGVTILKNEDGETRDDVMERLRIEKLIRTLNLRREPEL